MFTIFCVDYWDVDLTQFGVVGRIEALVCVAETGDAGIFIDGGNVRAVVDADETTVRGQLFFKLDEGDVVDGKGEARVGVDGLDGDEGSGIGYCAGDIGF